MTPERLEELRTKVYEVVDWLDVGIWNYRSPLTVVEDRELLSEIDRLLKKEI